MKKIFALLILAAACGFTSNTFALTSADNIHILYLKQEEKLARDVYQALYVKWGHTLFSTISSSEQLHMNAVDGLIKRFGLTDTTPTQAGVFTIPKLQTLYNLLIARGSKSLEDALIVGVIIEETDIADIQEILDTTTETSIRRVASNLQAGSYNHLAAFNKALD